MQEKLGKEIGEKEGILQGFKNIKINNIDWWTIIFTIAGIVIVGGTVAYFLFHSDTNPFITPLKEHVTSVVNAGISGNTEKIGNLNTNIMSLVRTIQDLDVKIENIQNKIDMISSEK